MRTLHPLWPRIVVLLLCLAACPAMAEPPSPGPDDRIELSAAVRVLGFRDMREPRHEAPSLGLVADRGGWIRNWTETRVYAALAYRLVDLDWLEFAPGWRMGTAVGRFEAKNAAVGFAESWDTRPALLWGPSARLVLRRARGQGVFLRLTYEFFAASARDASRSVSSLSGTAGANQNRDAIFTWTSQEATAALGYDWGKLSFAAGATLTAFALEKRLPQYSDPSLAGQPLLAAYMAGVRQSARYGYEPRNLVVPYLSMTFHLGPRWSFLAEVRPAAIPDATASVSFRF